ncbi:MAG: hypothetical protein H6740_10665 [Alphaproteobacteria bacterium]|nr:hypothetical protein [Alphaproteobacteria bacterium]
MRTLLATILAWLALCAPAWATDELELAQIAELERARAEVAGQVHLVAFDLLDELAYGWTQEPVFDKPTPVVLAGMSVPVGLGTGMQALLENHLADVVINNPSTNVRLVHCPQCTAVVVHSGPQGTVVSRGVDNPDVLAQLGDNSGKYALFIDVEAEGAFLVLRARLTEMSPDLPIVWSRTLSSSTSSPALLRQPAPLKSAEEARQEYLDTLQRRGQITIPARVAVRVYALPQGDRAGTAPPPFYWLQAGVEMSPTAAQRWTAGMMLGYTIIPDAYQGLMTQARISRLLTGRSRSLIRPDLYLFGGVALTGVWGPATTAFRGQTLTIDEILTDNDLEDARAAFGALHLGVETRLGNRIGFSFFLETLPQFNRSRNFGRYVRVAGVEAHALGAEVTVCF